MRSLSLDHLRSIAADTGLSIAGAASVAEMHQDGERLRAWQDAGFAGDMKYMQRDPLHLASPRRLLPHAESIVSVAISYPSQSREELPVGHGRVARYAWGVDYHDVIPVLLSEFVSRVSSVVGETIDFRVATDAVPLLERAVAKRSGLGFIGKNTMLIASRTGSFLFLGEIVWNLAVEQAEASPAARGRCGECTRCLDACPTGAFVAPYSLDARKCISYLTIEKPGVHEIADRRAVGEWVFGCDVCQEVCPFNSSLLKIGGRNPRDFFERSEGALGPFLDLAVLLNMRSDAEFRRFFARSPILRARRAGMLRNAAMVAANTNVEPLIDPLLEASQVDNSPTVRRTALWAAVEIARATGSNRAERVRRTVERQVRDTDSDVSAEAYSLLQGWS